MCSLYSSEPSEAAGSVRGDGSPFTPLWTKVNFSMPSLPNRPAPRRPKLDGVFTVVSLFLTNFCANGSKPRNTGVVGELVTPRMPTTPSDPGLLNFSKKLIFVPGLPGRRKSAREKPVCLPALCQWGIPLLSFWPCPDFLSSSAT